MRLSWPVMFSERAVQDKKKISKRWLHGVAALQWTATCSATPNDIDNLTNQPPTRILLRLVAYILMQLIAAAMPL